LIITMGLTGVIWAELRNRDDYLVPNLISRLVQACVLLAGSTLLHHWGMLSVHTTLTLYAVASVLTLLLLTAYQPSLPDAVAWVMGRQTGRLFSYFKDNALTITAPQITLILPGFFVGPETLAVLRVAQQMANLSLLLPTSIYYIYVPRLVQAFKAHALAPYRAAMRFVRLWGTASLLFAIGAAVILTPIVGRLFSGVDMTQTYTLFLWLSVGNMAAAALGPTNQVLSLIGRVDFNFHLMVVSTAAMGVMGGLVMGMGADIVYFIALTALSTTLVKIVAQRELTKQETSGPQMKNSGQSHSEAGHKG
jgi:O-antigen/teichoic acid export membrane protein